VRGFSVLIVAAVGCGHAADSKKVVSPSSQPTAHVKIAVLPAESREFPGVADAINSSLQSLKPDGSEVKVSNVSLEVVQLSIECVDQTATCYAKAGSSLEADQLLFAEISTRREKVHVSVTLFDVTTQMATDVAEQQFDDEASARSGADRLVRKIAADVGRL
jgi:hypothetical protein